MSDSHSRLTTEDPDPHQGQADPGQPVLARLTVGVEEGLDALKNTQIERHVYIDYFNTRHYSL